MVDLRTQLALCLGGITVRLEPREDKGGFTIDPERFGRWLARHNRWFRDCCGDRIYLLRGRELVLSGDALLEYPAELRRILDKASEEGYAVKLQTGAADCRNHWETLAGLCEGSAVIGLILEFKQLDAAIPAEELERFLWNIRALKKTLMIAAPTALCCELKLLASPALNSADIVLFLRPEEGSRESAPAEPQRKCAGRMSLYVTAKGLVYPCACLDRFPDQAIGDLNAEREEELLRIGDELLEYMVLGPDLPADGPVVAGDASIPWMCRRHVAELTLRP